MSQTISKTKTIALTNQGISGTPANNDHDFYIGDTKDTNTFVNTTGITGGTPGTVDIEHWGSPDGITYYNLEVGGTDVADNATNEYAIADTIKWLRVRIKDDNSVKADGTLTLSGDLDPAAAATGTLTLTDVITADETVTIGETVYTAITTIVAADVAATGTLTLTGNLTADDEVVLGATTYTAKAAIAAQAATGTFTLTGNVSAKETITIGNKTYTFLGYLPQSVPNVVLIGANAEASLDNLVAAINGAAGAGTTYSSVTQAHTQVTAADGAGTTVDVTAITPGTGGNSIATTDTTGDTGWGGANLSGGAAAAAANAFLIGGTASDTIDNLIAAINGDEGEGTLYGTGTVANASATAAEGTGDTMDVTAIVAGAAGNSITSTTTSGDASWGAGNLENGADATDPYYFAIGVDTETTLDNLVAAINGDAGEGTLYSTGTVAHPDVTAADGTGTTVDVTASVAGADGNSIATTTDCADGSWGDTDLTGGLDAEFITIGSRVYTASNPLIDEPNYFLVGTSASATCDNLIAAINGAAGEGTTYGTGTVPHELVTAAADTGDVVDVIAKLAGTAGNSIATAPDPVTNGSWGAATLENGVDGVTGSVDVTCVSRRN